MCWASSFGYRKCDRKQRTASVNTEVGVEKDKGNRFHSTEQLQFSLGWKITEKSKATVLFL